MKKLKSITNKQRRFVQEYLKDLNAKRAAIRAGYSTKTAQEQGSRLLSKANVSAMIKSGMLARQHRVEIDADYILIAAKELLERCMQRIPVMEFNRVDKCMAQKTAETDSGEVVGVWEFDSAGANAALKLLASHIPGFIAPTKTELSGKDGATISMFTLTMGDKVIE